MIRFKPRFTKELEQWTNLTRQHQQDHALLLDASEKGAKISYDISDLDEYMDKEFKDFLREKQVDPMEWINKTTDTLRLDVLIIHDSVML